MVILYLELYLSIYLSSFFYLFFEKNFIENFHCEGTKQGLWGIPRPIVAHSHVNNSFQLTVHLKIKHI